MPLPSQADKRREWRKQTGLHSAADREGSGDDDSAFAAPSERWGGNPMQGAEWAHDRWRPASFQRATANEKEHVVTKAELKSAAAARAVERAAAAANEAKKFHTRGHATAAAAASSAAADARGGSGPRPVYHTVLSKRGDHHVDESLPDIDSDLARPADPTDGVRVRPPARWGGGVRAAPKRSTDEDRERARRSHAPRGKAADAAAAAAEAAVYALLPRPEAAHFATAAVACLPALDYGYSELSPPAPICCADFLHHDSCDADAADASADKLKPTEQGAQVTAQVKSSRAAVRRSRHIGGGGDPAAVALATAMGKGTVGAAGPAASARPKVAVLLFGPTGRTLLANGSKVGPRHPFLPLATLACDVACRGVGFPRAMFLVT